MSEERPSRSREELLNELSKPSGEGVPIGLETGAVNPYRNADEYAERKRIFIAGFKQGLRWSLGEGEPRPEGEKR